VPLGGDSWTAFVLAETAVQHTPMAMVVVHATGGVGLAGVAEWPQPVSTIATPTHIRIRINNRRLSALDCYKRWRT
jgi:hypothetical protein